MRCSSRSCASSTRTSGKLRATHWRTASCSRSAAASAARPVKFIQGIGLLLHRWRNQAPAPRGQRPGEHIEGLAIKAPAERRVLAKARVQTAARAVHEGECQELVPFAQHPVLNESLPRGPQDCGSCPCLPRPRRNRTSWRRRKPEDVHVGGRVRRNAREERRVGVRGIAQHGAQGIEQLRGARPAGRIRHENDGGALMGRRVGFLRKQMRR